MKWVRPAHSAACACQVLLLSNQCPQKQVEIRISFESFNPMITGASVAFINFSALSEISDRSDRVHFYSVGQVLLPLYLTPFSVNLRPLLIFWMQPFFLYCAGTTGVRCVQPLKTERILLEKWSYFRSHYLKQERFPKYRAINFLIECSSKTFRIFLKNCPNNFVFPQNERKSRAEFFSFLKIG